LCANYIKIAEVAVLVEIQMQLMNREIASFSKMKRQWIKLWKTSIMTCCDKIEKVSYNLILQLPSFSSGVLNSLHKNGAGFLCAPLQLQFKLWKFCEQLRIRSISRGLMPWLSRTGEMVILFFFFSLTWVSGLACAYLD
jgi:hypothetical protein